MGSIILEKVYDPSVVEERWGKFWIEREIFRADPDSEKVPFSIVIPPPNVTGSLHMGHALNVTLQDILIRYRKMCGYNVLWVPGTDHAGIATQNVVERLLAQEGLTREALGREKFLERVWQWKEQSGGTIIRQLKRLGAACDWSRERFTMDPGLSRAVRHAFVGLYKKGLIYRDNYMINWCPRCHTALSDLEVEYETVRGKLYYMKYPGEGGPDVVVATTRPETMLGDTAVAVNPEDERYRGYEGAVVHLPLTGRKIPIIYDRMVDPEFGTGAVKITPSHDFNDFQVALSHGLPFVKVIDESGVMTDEAGERYRGLDRFECRKRVVEDLEKDGLLVRVEDYEHNVGHCYRCKTVIEPMVSLQWFVRTKPLAEKAIKAVEEGRTRIIPEVWTKTYFEWLYNIRDWCISRQIWWGHRIPAWFCDDCGEITVDYEDPASCASCGSGRIRQEEDVLDTWFSSALWPFSTLGWPDRTKDLEVFYPTSVLVTGFDILFFWVARMMMMGLEFMGDVPFRDVYIHALVRDAQGQKMSKTRGNVIDPLDVMDKFGTDAFRFTLTALAAQG
ncbi:MAG: valine--tRNA ligase, partial [Deltaproteobacteria bacterium]